MSAPRLVVLCPFAKCRVAQADVIESGVRIQAFYRDPGEKGVRGWDAAVGEIEASCKCLRRGEPWHIDIAKVDAVARSGQRRVSVVEVLTTEA